MLGSSYTVVSAKWEDEIRLYYWRAIIILMRLMRHIHRCYKVLRANWRTLVIAFCMGIALGLGREVIDFIW